MKKLNIFVATDGNDQNAGTVDAPLATLEAAKRRIRKYRESEMEVTVNIRGRDFFPNRFYQNGKPMELARFPHRGGRRGTQGASRL